MRRLFVRLGLLAVGLFLAFVAAEVFLRRFPEVLSEGDRLRIHWAGLARKDSTTIAHPTIGSVSRSGLHTIERSDLSFTCSIDQNGFRNPWPWPETADVVAVGDSLTFGYGVDDGLGWTDQVAKSLDLSVLNLGIVGAAPQMGLAAYEAYGVDRKPRVLLFGVFPGNDVQDAAMFERWQEVGGDEPNFGIWRALGTRPKGFVGRAYMALNRSYVVTALRGLKQKEHWESLTLDLSGGGRIQLVPDNIGGAWITDHSGKDFTRVLDTVVRASEVTQEHGTRLVVLFFPTKEEVYVPIATGRPLDLIQPFKDASVELGIEVLDTTPALQESARRGEQLYFEIDGHLNAAGYAVVAEVVSAHLRANAERYALPR